MIERYTARDGAHYLADTIASAREWLLDIADTFSDDPDDYADTITELPADEVRSAVERYYDGGWRGFLYEQVR